MSVIVTEKDIFDFIFHRSALSKALIRKIESDPSLREKLEYYKDLKSVTEDDDLDDLITAKLARRISAFKPEPVELFPSGGMSFIDKHKKYYACIEESSDNSVIYLFSPIKKLILNYSLTIIPSGKIIRQQDNLTPATIDKEPKIELIKLEFN